MNKEHQPNERTRQEQEIATIKERQIKINLSDADTQRLWEKAGSVGMTAGDLLAAFIGDLVCGTYTNGSDERMYAQQWFDRCCFSMFPATTFLRYLLECGELETFIINEQSMIKDKNELAELEAQPDKDSDDQEYIETLKENISYWQENTDQVFTEFVKWCKGYPHGSYEEEMPKVREWYKNMMVNLK